MTSNSDRAREQAELKQYLSQFSEQGTVNGNSAAETQLVSFPTQTTDKADSHSEEEKLDEYLGQFSTPAEEKVAEGRRNKQKESREGAVYVSRTDQSDPGVVDKLKREIFDIEERTDLTMEEKVSQITHITCAACAGVAVQPIPFADIFILTPIQAYMGSRIAAIRGVPVSESEASDVIKEILGVIGMGFAAQQIAIGIWKALIPGAGGFMTIPIVYGLSYAIMRVMDAYFAAKAARRKLTPDEIKSIWRNAKTEGEKHGEAHRAEENS